MPGSIAVLIGGAVFAFGLVQHHAQKRHPVAEAAHRLVHLVCRGGTAADNHQNTIEEFAKGDDIVIGKRRGQVEEHDVGVKLVHQPGEGLFGARVLDQFRGIGFDPVVEADGKVCAYVERVAAQAAEMIFTGDLIDAQEALRLGIVSKLFEPAGLMDATLDLARRIAAGPPVAIRLAKKNLRLNANEPNLQQALDRETAAQNLCFDMQDAREGMKAFVEKRDPVFKGE